MLRTILILDHDEDDVYITKSAFAELGLDIELHVVDTADRLFEHLNGCIRTNSALPSLILLSYNAIPVGALEVIKALKSSQLFCAIPLVVGCGVVNDKIVRACYAEGVSSFIKKADSVEGMKKSILNFVNYWSNAVLVAG